MSAILLTVRPYWALVSARFRMLLQYRAAALAGTCTQIFFGIVRMMIFQAFYESSSQPQPMTYAETVNYIWLSQAMLGLILFYVEPELQVMIRSGNVAYEMVRPIDLYSFWYSRVVASRAAAIALRAAPQMVIAGLFFGLQAPASWTCAFLWLGATLASLLLAGAISTFMAISLFWTLSGEGIVWIVSIATMFFSGLIIPLPLLPDWMQPMLDWMPFAGLADIPFRLYMGHIPPHEGLMALGRQVFWIAGFVVMGRVMLNRGVRRLVAQGG